MQRSKPAPRARPVFKCPDCDNDVQIKGMWCHLFKIHGKKRLFRCPFCKYETTTSSHLALHIKTHYTGVFKYICPYTKQLFKSTTQLQVHITENEKYTVIRKVKTSELYNPDIDKSYREGQPLRR